MDPNFSQSYQGASFRLLHKHQLRNFSMRDSLRFSSWIWRKIMPNARRLRATTVWLVLSIHSVSINCTMLQRSCSRCMNHGCLAEHNPLTPSSCVESWDNLARISSWLPIQWLTKPGFDIYAMPIRCRPRDGQCSRKTMHSRTDWTMPEDIWKADSLYFRPASWILV